MSHLCNKKWNWRPTIYFTENGVYQITNYLGILYFQWNRWSDVSFIFCCTNVTYSNYSRCMYNILSSVDQTTIFMYSTRIPCIMNVVGGGRIAFFFFFQVHQQQTKWHQNVHAFSIFTVKLPKKSNLSTTIHGGKWILFMKRHSTVKDSKYFRISLPAEYDQTNGYRK